MNGVPVSQSRNLGTRTYREADLVQREKRVNKGKEAQLKDTRGKCTVELERKKNEKSVFFGKDMRGSVRWKTRDSKLGDEK